MEDVRVGQGHDRERRFHRLTGDDHRRLAEVVSGVARRVREGDEDLFVVLTGPGDRLGDLGDPALIVVLVTQALEYPLGRVALLGRGILVVRGSAR